MNGHSTTQSASFLAEVSAELAESLDYDASLQKVARLATAGFAGFCILDVVTDDGMLRRVATAATTTEKELLLGELRERFPVEVGSTQPAARALRAREPVVLHFRDERALATTARSTEHLQLLRRVAPVSAIACPMVANDELIGLLTFGFFDELAYEENALLVATELARRAARALGNAMLYRNARRAEAARARLLAMVSHELRTSMSAILGWSHMLRTAKLSGEKRERALANIERNALEHAAVIDELLDASRILLREAP